MPPQGRHSQFVRIRRSGAIIVVLCEASSCRQNFNAFCYDTAPSRTGIDQVVDCRNNPAPPKLHPYEFLRVCYDDMLALRLDRHGRRSACSAWLGLLLALAVWNAPKAEAGDPGRRAAGLIPAVCTPAAVTHTAGVNPATRLSSSARLGLASRGQDPDADDSESGSDSDSPAGTQPDTEQKFPTDDNPPPDVPIGGAWSLLDPKFIGPDGTPGVGPWLLTFFTARTLPTFKADIKEPGPDSANFPNSAFTLPPGEVYIETSLITFQKTPSFNRQRVEGQAEQITLPTLIRVGVFRDFELRLFSTTFQSEEFQGLRVNGVGPLMFDSKFHFWDQDKEQHIPAFGVQIMSQSNLGSPRFSLSQWEPAFSLNFDYELESGFELEWNVGGSWTVDADDERIYEASFQWSIQRELVKNVDGFLHGYLNVPESTRFREGAVFGGGLIWYVSSRIAIDSSYSFAIKPGSPNPIVRLGLSLAL